MRITQNMSADSSIYNLQQGRSKLDKLQQLSALQQNNSQPSDDPIATRLLLDIGDKLKAVDQYTSNITKGTISMKIVNTALQGMSDTMALAKQQVNTISSGNSDPTMRANIVSQLTALKQQMIDMGNVQNGDQYVFGGADNLHPPFLSKTGGLVNGSAVIGNIDITGLKAGMQVSGAGIPAGTVINSVTAGPPDTITLNQAATSTSAASTLNIYAGDETALKIEIANGSDQQINIPGNQLLTGSGSPTPYGTTNILKTFDDLIAAVTNNDAIAIQAGATQLENGARQITNAQSEMVSRASRLDNTSKLNANNRNTLETIVGNVQDVDYAKLAVQLSQQKIAFEASLSATANISKMSLLDYM